MVPRGDHVANWSVLSVDYFPAINQSQLLIHKSYSNCLYGILTLCKAPLNVTEANVGGIIPPSDLFHASFPFPAFIGLALPFWRFPSLHLSG